MINISLNLYIRIFHIFYVPSLVYVILVSLFKFSSENVGQGERSTTSSSKSEGAKGKAGPLLVTNPFIP